ncbi:hypothetical protein SAMN05421882_10844 [Nitrosomonas communis]|uniref:Uncharacterized protein n=1 Tax=Nitrosomonas communis TaxID=44574 RepID=A0A1H2ZMW3_9PROT|nr:hypothetical protein SAMN05421882_10844 [Nitrosomonas communis]
MVNFPFGLFAQLCISKLTGAADSDGQIQLSFFGAYFVQVNREVANRILLELFLRRLIAVYVGDPLMLWR